MCEVILRATFHTGLRAHIHCTSSTLIGGKGGGGPSLHQTTFKGPPEVRKCKMDVKSTWIPTWRQAGHVSCSFFQNHLLDVDFNRKNRETMGL